MEAMIAAAEAAKKAATAKPKRKVVKRRVVKAPASAAARPASRPIPAQQQSLEPMPHEPAAPPTVHFIPEEPTGPVPAWAAKRNAQDQPWAPTPVSLDASSQHTAPGAPIAPPMVPESPVPPPTEPPSQELASMPAWAAKKRGLAVPITPVVSNPPPQPSETRQPVRQPQVTPEQEEQSQSVSLNTPVSQESIPAWAAKKQAQAAPAQQYRMETQLNYDDTNPYVDQAPYPLGAQTQADGAG